MKITFLQEHILYWNGGVRYLFEICNRLHGEHNVNICVGQYSYINYQRFGRLPLHSFNWTMPNNLKYWLFYPLYLISHLGDIKDYCKNYFKTDVVFSISPTTHILCLLAGIKPILVTFELNPWLYTETHPQLYSPSKRFILKFWSPVAKYMEKMAYKNAVKIITWSKFVQSEIKRVYGVDSEVVYTGIDTEFFKKTENQKLKEKYKGKRIILHVASYLSPMKGTEYAVEAMGYVNKEFPDALLLIINSHNEFERQGELSALAHTVGAKIEFVTMVKDTDMPAYYSLAEVLLSPSLDENIHLPVLEAQSCGCPVVNFCGKYSSEELGWGGSAQNKNTKMLASMAVQYMTKINDFTISQARQFVLDNFSWDKCIGNYKRIIDEVVN